MRERPRAGTSSSAWDANPVRFRWACAKPPARRLPFFPRSFPKKLRSASVADTIVGSIVKQRSLGREYGVAVVAEGSPSASGTTSLARWAISGAIPSGTFRWPRFRSAPSCAMRCASRLSEIGVNSVVHTKDIGYELRCAKPVPFDVDYTRTLGFGAVRYLVDGGSGALIALAGGRVQPIKLDDLLDPATGRIRTRQVDSSTRSLSRRARLHGAAGAARFAAIRSA